MKALVATSATSKVPAALPWGDQGECVSLGHRSQSLICRTVQVSLLMVNESALSACLFWDDFVASTADYSFHYTDYRSEAGAISAFSAVHGRSGVKGMAWNDFHSCTRKWMVAVWQKATLVQQMPGNPVWHGMDKILWMAWNSDTSSLKGLKAPWKNLQVEGMKIGKQNFVILVSGGFSVQTSNEVNVS